VVTGGLLWHFRVRPAEKRDLLEHFGRDYASYRAQVRCWVPRTLPFSPTASGVR
jgi:protein-S-isoprenylcysteine O-methyltransferase Ste14